MAIIHGTNAVFSLDNSGGSPTDLTAKAKSIDFTLEQAMHDTTALGSTSRTKTTGLKDGKFTVHFFSDNTVMDHLTGLFGAQTPGGSSTWSFVYGPRGSTSGYEKFSGEAILTSIPLPAEVDNIEMLVAQFEVTGAVTIGTY